MHPDYEDLSDDDLRELAERRDLPTEGGREDLIARLELQDAENENEGGTPSGPLDDTPEDSTPEGDEERPMPRGTDPPMSAGTPRATTSPVGLPAQMRPENQDESVKGVTTNERGKELENGNTTLYTVVAVLVAIAAIIFIVQAL